MATAYKIHLSTEDAGIFNAGVTEEAALKVNEVLQDNLERHHIVYNMMGFHSKRYLVLGYRPGCSLLVFIPSQYRKLKHPKASSY